MRLKGLKIGKLMGKGEKHQEGEADILTAQEIDEGGQTGSEESPETTTGQSPEASELSPGEETPIKPHGPLEELSLDSAGDLEFDEAVNESIMPEEGAEPVKLVELKTETDELAGEESVGLDTDAPVPEEGPKEEELKPADDSFDSLFADDEDEENPLANLINSLPEVSAQEIINDIIELKDIMREGH